MDISNWSDREICEYWQPETENEKVLHGLLCEYRDKLLDICYRYEDEVYPRSLVYKEVREVIDDENLR